MTDAPAMMIRFGAGLALCLVVPAPGLANPLTPEPLAEVSPAVNPSEPAVADPATNPVVLSDPVVLTLDAADPEHPLSLDSAKPAVAESWQVMPAHGTAEISDLPPDDPGPATAFSAADLELGETLLETPPTLASPGDLNLSQALEEEPSEDAADASVWQFSFEPFIALPLNTRINSTTQDIGIDIDLDIGEIASSFNRLNFAFLGKFEAWYENQGVVFSTEYFAAGGGQVRNFNVPPRLQGRLPGTLTADFSADLLKADLMYAHRFSAPPENGYGPGFTEFDLPPISFDLMGGVRLYWLAQEATLTSDLGGAISQSTSTILPEPVIRGRLRWNTSDYLAIKLDGNISGFGAGDFFTFSVAGLAALEWMFSGDTSLSVGYQLNHVNFNRANRDDGTSNINLTSHGPYLSFLFRF